MNSKLKYIKILLLLFCLYSCNSRSNHIPEKHPDISQEEYDNFLDQLNEAYLDGDKIKAAFQLSNLKAESDITYNLLNNGIREDSSSCEDIYDWYYLYDRNNFRMNILKLDTNQFKNSVRLCDQTYKSDSYAKFAIRKDVIMKEAHENRPIEDSTLFNMELVRRLEQIDKDDQEVRIRSIKKNISRKLKMEIGKEMKVVDSINLIKVNLIFQEYGYPGPEIVGIECSNTPALVIHHCVDLPTRYKYMPFLEEAVDKGLLNEGRLNMIKIRNEHLELAQEK